MAVRVSHPRFRREGIAPRIELTDDDVAILRHVHRHRFVRADDLYRLVDNRTPDRVSRRLTLLFRNEFLDRPIAQVDRYREGGSQALVYGLGNAGARYLKEALGMPIGPTDWRARNRSYTRENLDHTLATSRFLIDLELACRQHRSMSLIPFEEILVGAAPQTRLSRSPMTWPVPVQWHGGKTQVQIAPDAVFGLRSRENGVAAKRAYFFLEIDRGTMTIVPGETVRESEAFPYRATMLRKFYAYADSFRLGLHKARFGIGAPRVLILTTSAKRAKAMQENCERFVVRPFRLPAPMYLFGLIGSSRSDPLSMRLVDASGVPTGLCQNPAV